MSEHEGLALLKVLLDGLSIYPGLEVVRRQHHNHVRLLSDFGHSGDPEAGLLGLGPAGAALVQPNHHVYAAVIEAQGVGVALAPVPDDPNGLALKQRKVCIIFVVNIGHSLLPPYSSLNLCRWTCRCCEQAGCRCP